MKRIKKNYIILLLILSVQAISTSISPEYSPGQFILIGGNDDPKSADVSGNELYAEQIQVTIASNQSIIRQSYITNDTNIFARVDLADPAFDRSAFYMSVSNGKPTLFHPMPISDVAISQYSEPVSSLSGFIYYDNQSDFKTTQTKIARAILILKEAFQIDLIQLQSTESAENGYYYPFIGYYPKWDRYIETVLSNTPNDGYWAAFDQKRILSTNYLQNHHFSSSLLYTRDFESLNNGFGGNAPTDLNTFFDLSMINSLSGLSGIFSQLNESGILDNLGGTENETTEGDSSSISSLDIEGMLENFYKSMTNLVLTQVQYEATPIAITPTNSTANYFDFDLFKALGYKGDSLMASRKAFNSLIGALLCGITMSLMSAEAIDTTPDHLFFDNYNIERIQTILFLIGNSVDISILKDYSFKIGWQSQEFLSNLVIIPENLNNASDPINYLQVLGFLGLPMILGGIINPLENFKLTYKLLDKEPTIRLTRSVSNASQALFENPVMTIRAENVGYDTVWGQTLNLSSFGIYNDPVYYFGANSPLILALNSLGYDIDAMFHDENPRVFMFDTYGTGLYDYIYPGLNLFDFDPFTSGVAIAPYSQDFTDALIADSAVLGAFVPGGQPAVIALAYTFNSSQSVFNPSNWKIEPEEYIEYTITTLNTTIQDSYTTFYTMPIAEIPSISPIISYGQENMGSNLNNARFFNDTLSWDLSSSLIGEQNILQQYLSFQNQSTIDYQLNSTDAINIQLVYSTDTMLSMNIEIYDYLQEVFVAIQNINGIIGNHITNITIPNHLFDVDNFYQKENNNAILLRITYTNDTNAFTIKTDYIQTAFQDRDTNELNLMPARLLFNSLIGNNQYTASSNSVVVSTDDIASITSYVTIESPDSFCGELNGYNMTITNLGNKPAFNVSIQIEQPGLIENIHDLQVEYIGNVRNVNATAGNFTLTNGILEYNIAVFNPGQILQNLSFQFYTPNSRRSPSAIVQWEDQLNKNILGFDYFGLSNQIYISAPIRYNTLADTPYTHRVSMKYTSDFSVVAPKINEVFEVVFQVQNNGDQPIYDLHIQIPKGINGLLSTDVNETIWIPQLNSGENIQCSLNYTKISFLGNLLPSLSMDAGLEYKLINLAPNSPIILGQIKVSLTKEIEIFDAEEGTIFTIKVKFVNLGNVELGNFSISDLESYDAVGFRIIEGNLVKFVDILNPGESIEFEYKLVITQKGNYIMRGAKFEYFFIYKNVVQTEDVAFKAREPYWILTSRLFLPIMLGFGLIYLTFRMKTKYHREDAEFERRETLLFGASLRETAWHKKNLQEFMDELSQTDDEAKVRSEN